MADVRKVADLCSPEVIDCLRMGGIVVARTDTLYGVLARADNEVAVTRVYSLKHRSQHKSPIVLVADRQQIYGDIPTATARLMDSHWPGPVSIIVPTTEAPKWLRRENDSVAYRMPADEELRRLISQTGRLIAPSANPEARQPALSVEQAQDYFGERVDIYVDGGRLDNDSPSQLLRIDDKGRVERLR